MELTCLVETSLKEKDMRKSTGEMCREKDSSVNMCIRDGSQSEGSNCHTLTSTVTWKEFETRMLITDNGIMFYIFNLCLPPIHSLHSSQNF